MKATETQRVLVIAPHADDAEFGMGGYLSRMIREDLAMPTVAVIAGGDYVNRAGANVSGEARLNETAEAMKRLGVTSFVTLGAAPENEFDLVGRRVLLDAVDELLRRASYDEVFVNLPSHNQDHVALYEAVLASFRPGRHPWVKRLWAYEYPGHSIDSEQPLMGRCYVKFQLPDLNAKIASLKEHKTQFAGKVQNHCGPAGARLHARFRGSEAGGEWAELFWLIKEIY